MKANEKELVPVETIETQVESNVFSLIMSCPSCGDEQIVEMVFYPPGSGSPMLQMMEAIMYDEGEEIYRFGGKNKCANCNKEVIATLQVTARNE